MVIMLGDAVVVWGVTIHEGWWSVSCVADVLSEGFAVRYNILIWKVILVAVTTIKAI